MDDLGKADREFFDEYVYPNLGADRADVRVGPQHGVDFGVIDVGDRAIATATDPVFVMPSLGFERAAWFAFHVLMSDVAVSGITPTHLSVDLNLPPEITNEEFADVWQTFDAEARELGVSVVTGHTGRYAGCNYPMVGGGTVLGVGDPEDLVRPDGARPGDKVLITKGPAIEATGLLSIQFESLLREELTDDAIPMQPGVEEACEFFDIDPWISISEGTLLLTVAPDGVEDVLAALESEEIPAAEVGDVSEGSGVEVDGEAIDHPERDPFWSTFEEYVGKLEGEE